MCSKIISPACIVASILTLACGSCFAQETSTNELLGTWESSVGYETLTLVFHSSTQLEFDGESASYSLSGNVIRVQEDYGSVDYPYSLEGNTLTIAFPDGTQLAFARMSTGDRQAGTSSPDVSSRSPETNPPARGRPQTGGNSADAALTAHFTGIWMTWTKNTQTKAYLAPDGTYYQNYEASYSGGANDPSGAWGTAREDRTQARWTVQGNRHSGVLVLTYADGSTDHVRYQVHEENGQIYWSEYYFEGTLYAKQRE